MWECDERHTRRIAAPPARVYAAIRTLPAGDIRFFHTLTWLRRFGRPLPPCILHAPKEQSIIDTAVAGGFVLLAEDAPRELAVGAVVIGQGRLTPPLTPAQFGAIAGPGFAKATMNFLIADDGAGGSIVTTETRVHGTDARSARRFAMYWRIIQPGSALIRRMWLRAIQRRARRRVGIMSNRMSMVSAVLFAAGLAGLVAAPAVSAQTPSASGHWTGVLDTPAQPLDVEVDLKPGTPPAWVGTISIPAQNLKAFPLSSIEVQGTSVSFVMANVPGTPTFKGTLAADGATISGDFSQGGGSIPFRMTRKGDAVFTAPAKSTAVTKELEGTWNGSLAAGEQTLRLTLKLANGPDAATGSHGQRRSGRRRDPDHDDHAGGVAPHARTAVDRRLVFGRPQGRQAGRDVEAGAADPRRSSSPAPRPERRRSLESPRA